jgi:thiamine biosynthesis lipoprotein
MSSTRNPTLLHPPFSRALFPAAALLPLVALLPAPGLAKAEHEGFERFEFSLPRMGTMARIELYAADKARATTAAAAAFDRLEALEQILSDYREDSELTILSREGASAPHAVSPELFFVLDRSLYFSRLSGGAFDVTIGPVVQLWREARRAGKLPDSAALARAKAVVGYQNVVLDPTNRTVFLKRAGMKLDLGAIAKGYAADQALELLRSRGISSALVALGGELALGAPPPDKPGWRVVIGSADASRSAAPCTLVVYNVALSTSGDGEQFLDLNGKRYSHVINPASGAALQGRASTTVIAPDGTTADALATAISVLPVRDGIRLAESQRGVSALIVRKTERGWQHFTSRGFPRPCREMLN